MSHQLSRNRPRSGRVRSNLVKSATPTLANVVPKLAKSAHIGQIRLFPIRGPQKALLRTPRRAVSRPSDSHNSSSRARHLLARFCAVVAGIPHCVCVAADALYSPAQQCYHACCTAQRHHVPLFAIVGKLPPITSQTLVPAHIRSHIGFCLYGWVWPASHMAEMLNSRRVNL